jgi:Uma2 family endonuclease
MRIIPSFQHPWKNGYPTSDGKPMAETDWHRDAMAALISSLSDFFAEEPLVYVSGNLLLFYEEGNRRRRVAPDVFVIWGVEKLLRPNYLLWKEGHAPQVVIEVTSSKTKHQDRKIKWALYQDTLRVREYFLFDPDGDWLDPPLQGYRLREGTYRPIRCLSGRLPSQVLRLHLERDGRMLRLWNPATQLWLPTPREARRQAERRAEQIETQNAQLRQELEALRRQLGIEE